MKCKHCGHEIEERETLIVDGYEYEVKEHSFDKTLDEIEIPEGWELWTHEDCIKLRNDEKLREKLNLQNCWFFIKQPFKQDYVARFNADSGRAYLYCDGDAEYRYGSLGVRFKRKVGK